MAARSSVRLDPVSRDIALIRDEVLSPEAQGEAFASLAREVIAEAQETNRQALGYKPDYDLYVDGSERASLDGLRPSNIVLAEFHLLLDVIEWVDAQLILHSPVKTERYARSHQWFADNVAFDDPTKPPPAESYIVLNSQPYARKIERGQSAQAPAGVYEAVAVMARRRFGNIAYVGFTYRSFPGGAVGDWAQSASAQALGARIRKGRAGLKQDWLTRQPAIYIDPGR